MLQKKTTSSNTPSTNILDDHKSIRSSLRGEELRPAPDNITTTSAQVSTMPSPLLKTLGN